MLVALWRRRFIAGSGKTMSLFQTVWYCLFGWGAVLLLPVLALVGDKPKRETGGFCVLERETERLYLMILQLSIHLP